LFRFLYNVIFPVALLVTLPAYLARMLRRGNWRRGFGERFGKYTREVAERLGALPAADRTWIHAVSVGEVMLALKLIAALRARQPDLPIVVTTTTTTGHALAEKRLPKDVTAVYAPLDFPPFVRRAFNVIQPARIALVEAEVWPNWMAEAERRGVPVHLVNARLSPRSESRFLRFRALVAPIFRKLAWISVPEQIDLSRWAAIGLPPEKLHCLGSIKFDDDTAPAESPRTAEFRTLLATAFPTSSENRKFILAGSTHLNEEVLLAKTLLALRPRFPGLHLLIAPRHVERTNAIAEELLALGLRIARRSLLDPKFTLLEEPDVLLLDSTGELRDWYPLASVVFVGKSMASEASGGQNPAEPIAAGVPTICGPRMENFADLMESLRAADGIVEVPNVERLQDRIGWLLDHPEDGRKLVARGRAVLNRHGGAAQRNAELLLAAAPRSR
jgi:3-deoxy-D-manno-octulosonic-acid transferase